MLELKSKRFIITASITVILLIILAIFLRSYSTASKPSDLSSPSGGLHSGAENPDGVKAKESLESEENCLKDKAITSGATKKEKKYSREMTLTDAAHKVEVYAKDNTFVFKYLPVTKTKVERGDEIRLISSESKKFNVKITGTSTNEAFNTIIEKKCVEIASKSGTNLETLLNDFKEFVENFSQAEEIQSQFMVVLTQLKK